jgi:hypothetical protein
MFPEKMLCRGCSCFVNAKMDEVMSLHGSKKLADDMVIRLIDYMDGSLKLITSAFQ